MSYIGIQPEFYQMLVPGTPWSPATNDDWKSAPWPTWGYNPNEIGPKRQGVGALGCPCSGKSGMGDVLPVAMGPVMMPGAGARLMAADTSASSRSGPAYAPAPPPNEPTGLARFATPIALGALAIGAGGLFWYLRKHR